MTTLFELAARLQTAKAAEEMLWMVLKATVILALARLLLVAMPRASAAMKHVIATATLVAVAAMPIATFVLPSLELPVASSQLPAETAAPDAGNRQLATGNQAGSQAVGNRQSATVGLSDNEPIATAISVAKATGIADAPIGALERAMKVFTSTWKGMIVVWIGIASLLMIGHMLLGVIGVGFVARSAQELTSDEALQALDYARDRLQLAQDVKLLRSPRIAVPVVWGIRRPVLLLPPDVITWPAERLRVVLMHELAHLKRWDGVSLLLTRAAVSLFWFHPLAWSLERAGRSECERACDDLVLASGTKPSEYADHLLAIARTMPAFDPFRSVTLAMSRKTQLEGRLLSILQRDTARRVFSVRGIGVACALAVAVIVPVSAVKLIARPPAPPQASNQVIVETPLKSDSQVDVTPQEEAERREDITEDVESIGDFLLAKLGKYDKRADRWIREPRNAEERYERAYDFYRNDRYEEAAAMFRRAGDEGYRPETSFYNAACSWALLGNANNAMAELNRAIDAGWDDFGHIADDSDFDPIRSDPRFRTLLQSEISDAANRRENKVLRKVERLKSSADKHDGDDWFNAGMDLLRLRKLDDSIQAFQSAIAANASISTSMYNIACAYSLKGDVRNGMIWLDKSIENGFSSEDKLKHDPDIALLRKQTADFARISDKAKDLEMRGCCGGAMAFVFDNWNKAVAHHRAMVQKHPSSGRAWFNLGYTSLQARDYTTSADAFRRALELGYRPATTSYNIACAHALEGNRDAAFAWLEKAEVAGFEDLADHARGDDDLDSLHRDPRWDDLVRR